MPTPRSYTASVTTEQALIVVAGHNVGSRLDTVEVMDIPSQQWTTASRLPELPHPFYWMSATIYCWIWGDQSFITLATMACNSED